MNLLEQLWRLADDAVDSRRIVGEPFGECGLFLVRPLERFDYFCTPLNTLTFANTGGDGVHYGFLQSDGVPNHEQPIVMTVPMGDQHNTVVAESLREFLGLGYFAGWFALEQLTYDPNWAINYFSQPDIEEWPERDRQVRLIRDALSIGHTILSVERINDLTKRYSPSLILPED